MSTPVFLVRCGRSAASKVATAVTGKRIAGQGRPHLACRIRNSLYLGLGFGRISDSKAHEQRIESLERGVIAGSRSHIIADGTLPQGAFLSTESTVRQLKEPKISHFDQL